MSGFNPGRSCITEDHFALLSSDFGLELAKKKLGNNFDDIIKKVGVFTNGKNKGKVKGQIQWTKVLEGGWDYQNGGVLRKGCVNFEIVCDGITYYIGDNQTKAKKDKELFCKLKGLKDELLSINEEISNEIQWLDQDIKDGIILDRQIKLMRDSIDKLKIKRCSIEKEICKLTQI
jgi:hypothetical protein